MGEKGVELGLGDLLRMSPHWGFVESEHNFKMFLAGNDDGVALRLLWNRKYEPYSIKLWRQMCDAGRIAIDVGAHTGIYTLAAYSAGCGKVFSFEPYFMNFARMNLNLRANGFSTKGLIYGAAGAKSGTGRIAIPVTHDYLSSGCKVFRHEVGNTFHETDIIAIDDLPLNEKVCGVKIDAEGYESFVLSGMKNLLEDKVPVLFECITDLEVEQLFHERGYELFIVDEEKETLEPVDRVVPEMLDGKVNRNRINRLALWGGKNA